VAESIGTARYTTLLPVTRTWQEPRRRVNVSAEHCC
jgi:hypothetical protein